MDAVTVALLALGLSAFIQIVTASFVYGKLTQKVADIERRVSWIEKRM